MNCPECSVFPNPPRLLTIILWLLGTIAVTRPISAGVIAASDFNGPTTVANRTARDTAPGATDWYFYSYGPSLLEVIATGGTIDAAGASRAAGKAVRLSANFAASATYWNAGFYTGRLPNLATGVAPSLLHLSFDLKVNRLHPVAIEARSYNAEGQLTGTSTAVVTPPVVDAYFRHGLDLSTFIGTFDPSAAQVEFGFVLEGNDAGGWPKENGLEILVDNLSYTAPSYYVSGTGSDAPSRDGRTPAGAFRTINRALAQAVPGDVIVVLEGTYTNAYSGVPIANFANINGSPARWITLRGHPSQVPLLEVNGWNGVGTSTGTASYVEVRGLTIRGNTQSGAYDREDALEDASLITPGGVPQQVDENGRLLNKYSGSYVYNSNGINFDGRGTNDSNARIHHVRILGNRVYENGGGGIIVCGSDYVTVQGNISHHNATHSRYASSGLSLLVSWNFHGGSGYRNFILQNRVFSNYVDVFWTDISYTPKAGASGKIPQGDWKYSDGNGIIVDNNQIGPDSNQVSRDNGDRTRYQGATLVQNNLSYGNGAAGLQSMYSRNVDFINNSTYLNSQKDYTAYGELFINRSSAIRVINNILWAPKGKPINRVNLNNSSDYTFKNNTYWSEGSNGVHSPAPLLQSNDGSYTTVWPRYVAPSLTLTGDFRLRPDAHSIDTGFRTLGTPIVDFFGRPRPDRPDKVGVPASRIDRGAHEY